MASIVRAVLSLRDDGLRAAYFRELFCAVPLEDLARELDALCAGAEQAEPGAREVLIALVDALAVESEATVQRLREQAAGESHLALERLLRGGGVVSSPPPGDPKDARVPDYGRGRTLTLGERKSLARRPDRAMIERLLGDPHPDVIKRVLANPRLTEEDVVRLAARRPCRADVLAEIARSTRWSHRPRVRLALALNPDTPIDLSTRIAGLLVRQELRLVAEATYLPAPLRAVCLEHLERRPPMEAADEEPRVH